MTIQQALTAVVEGRHLTREQMTEVMLTIMSGGASDAQIGGFLVALRMKGETLDEIAGAADAMRRLVTPVAANVDPLVDTCGTGGDGANLFNVSTASAFVVAAAGGKVAKHGNRSVTSSTGSADVLEAAGVNLALSPEQVGRCVEQVGLGFMFAPKHHSAMKHAIGPRKELSLRTIFNLLGPLTNPAGATRQVIGVFDATLCRPLAEVLKRLGSDHVLVVHSEDGLDEISLAATTHIAEMRNGDVSEYNVQPEAFGIATASLDGLAVNSAEDSLALIQDALGKRQTDAGRKAADLIALNAGAALYVAGVGSSLREGVQLAQDTIASGLAGEKIKELVEFTRVF